VHAMTERSLATVVRDIGGNVDRIIRAEFQLAVADIRTWVETFGDASVLLIIGGVAATLAAGFVLLSGFLALAHVMPPWLSALVISLVPGSIGTVMLLRCRTRIARQLTPMSHEIVPAGRGL